MVQFNLALREINCKVVYFGPGLSGKTTNLEIVHKKAPEESRGVLSSIATESDRTLFFDFMPLNLGTVGGMKTKFQLYTVPGQVYYNSTRKLVLRGADGVVFVADSNPEKMAENLESLQNLEDCLKEQGRTLKEIPHVIQFNKRDLPNAMTPAQMEQALNRFGAPCFEAVANQGNGVIETFKGLSVLVLQKVKSMTAERAPERPQAPATSGVTSGSAAPAGSGPESRPPAAEKRQKPLSIQRNAPPMPKVAEKQETEKDAMVAVKEAPARSEAPRPERRPRVEEQHPPRRKAPSSSPNSNQRMIVSSKHARSGISPAVVGLIAALGGIVGTAVFFLFVKR
jgi:signal recognition particle receptor subunit beta